MSSTNKTTHYDLSQYVANDKPTYLVDYNQDMTKIDAGIYSAESKALVNEGVIGDITKLETTVKTNLVSAVNEVKAEADDNKDDITNLNTSVSANTGNIGVMANLQTTDKTNLVSAINEVKTETNNNTTNLNNFELEENVEMVGLVVSVDRMERGKGEKSALQEIQETYGFETTAIVTMADVVEHLYNKEYNGEVIIDDTLKAAIDAYYNEYGVK